MNKVFILGAGASKSYEGSKTGVQPPLAHELFKTFYDLEISGDLDVRIGDIVNYVRDTRGVMPKDFGGWNENIEDFLTEIEEKLISLLESVRQSGIENYELEFIELQKVYDRMIFLFSSILNEIQNGSIYNAYRELTKLADEGDAFVTFNWDTLLDQALKETEKWFPEDGYCVPFKAIFNDKWEMLTPNSNITKSKYKLYKLHGSTNWLIPYYTFNYKKGKWDFVNENAKSIRRPIYLFHYATSKYQTYQNRSRTGYEPFSYFYYPPDVPVSKSSSNFQFVNFYPDTRNYGWNENTNQTQASMPLIIPPVKNKNYDFLEGTVNRIWRKSIQEVRKAEQIYIIGYSFPPTDTKAWTLIDTISKRKVKPEIVLIDPFPEGVLKNITQNYPELEGTIEVYEMTLNEYLNLC